MSGHVGLCARKERCPARGALAQSPSSYRKHEQEGGAHVHAPFLPSDCLVNRPNPYSGILMASPEWGSEEWEWKRGRPFPRTTLTTKPNQEAREVSWCEYVKPL